MMGMNEMVEDKLKDVTQKYLDDDYLYQQFQKQVKKNSDTKGKKLAANKHFSIFHCKEWPQQVNEVTDHRGNVISKTGHKMDEVQALKEQEELMKQRMLSKKKLSLRKGSLDRGDSATQSETSIHSKRKRILSQDDDGI